MGVRFPSVATNTFIGPLPANANETVVFTTPPINEPIDNAQVLLFWDCAINPGTSTTNLSFRLRRGILATSPQITLGNRTIPAVPGTLISTGGCYFDLPGVVAGVQYSLTVIQTAATVAGVFNDGCLIAMVL
jgi:hypothetical protein